MARSVIESTLAAVTTDAVSFHASELPVNFVAIGLSSGESIDIRISNDDGVTWENQRVNGVDLTLSYDNPTRMLRAPGVYSFVKGVTTNPVSIGASTGVNP